MGAGFCSDFAALSVTALLKRGTIPASIYRGIDIDRCKGVLKSFPQCPNMLDFSSSDRMPHGEDACFLMSELPSTM